MSEILINCPYCVERGYSADPSSHLSINKEKMVYKGWRCGVKGKWTGKLPEKGKAYTPKINLADLDLFNIFTTLKKYDKYLDYILQRLPHLSNPYPTIFFSPQIENRVLFPMYQNGYLIALNGRHIENGKPKYKTIEQKSEGIYNYENVEDWGVLCEGSFDALSTPHGIAVWGKSLSDTQLKLILSKYSLIYIALDLDAEKERRDIIEKLGKYIEIIELKWDSHKHKDIAEIGYRKMEDALKMKGDIVYIP